MKVKVVKKFYDRHTKVIHRVNEEMEITQERFEEIQSVGDFVREIVISAPSDDEASVSPDESENAPESAPAASGDKLDSMTMKQLREYANAKYKITFPVGTKKSEIIDEIRRMSK